MHPAPPILPARPSLLQRCWRRLRAPFSSYSPRQRLVHAAWWAVSLHLIVLLWPATPAVRPPEIAGVRVWLGKNGTPQAQWRQTGNLPVLQPPESVRNLPSLGAAGLWTPPAASAASAIANAEDDYYYWNSTDLTVQPSAIGSVAIDYPAGFAPRKPHYGGVLLLYVDRNGVVQRVEAESGDLPPELIEAARRQFSRASFNPGQRAEHWVNAKVRIEISFDTVNPDFSR